MFDLEIHTSAPRPPGCYLPPESHSLLRDEAVERETVESVVRPLVVTAEGCDANLAGIVGCPGFELARSCTTRRSTQLMPLPAALERLESMPARRMWARSSGLAGQNRGGGRECRDPHRGAMMCWLPGTVTRRLHVHTGHSSTD